MKQGVEYSRSVVLVLYRYVGQFAPQLLLVHPLVSQQVGEPAATSSSNVTAGTPLSTLPSGSPVAMDIGNQQIASSSLDGWTLMVSAACLATFVQI